MILDAQGESYGYDSYNRLTDVGGPSNIELVYDPAGRLHETKGTGITLREFLYDGLDLIAEYDGTGAMQARYVHGPGLDEPLVQYAGSSLATRQWLHADERGSIVAVSNASGAAIQINAYDEYGVPQSGNAGRFGYTGQVWLPETGLYHYKNRAYNPALGRFMQADPIGVAGGMNLYAYVGGDPVNWVDPLGLLRCYTRTDEGPMVEQPCPTRRSVEFTFRRNVWMTGTFSFGPVVGDGMLFPAHRFAVSEANAQQDARLCETVAAGGLDEILGDLDILEGNEGATAILSGDIAFGLVVSYRHSMGVFHNYQTGETGVFRANAIGVGTMAGGGISGGVQLSNRTPASGEFSEFNAGWGSGLGVSASATFAEGFVAAGTAAGISFQAFQPVMMDLSVGIATVTTCGAPE